MTLTIRQISNNLRSCADYWARMPGPNSGKRFAFQKASSLLLNTFDPEMIVTAHYDFTPLSGISEGIQSRIDMWLAGQVTDELIEPMTNAEIELWDRITASTRIQQQLNKAGINNLDATESSS